MLNIEMYKDDILSEIEEKRKYYNITTEVLGVSLVSVSRKRLKQDMSSKKILDWLLEEAKFELTKIEYSLFLFALRNGYYYVYKDTHGTVFVSKGNNDDYKFDLLNNDSFEFIKSEETRMTIKEILDNCVIIDKEFDKND